MQPLLDIQDLSFSYHNTAGETPAVKDLSFHVDKGEFVSIVGPSGCGKSTLLSLITGLLKEETGHIYFSGKSISRQRPNIGYMLQKDQLLPWRNILRNVMLGAEIRHMTGRETKEKAKALLTRYGLSDFLYAMPDELSGGMRQRVALIRTLLTDPELLLLDEPFSALDYQTRLNVSDEIGQIIRKEHKTALLITHDLSEAISLADRVIVLSARPAKVRCEVPLAFSVQNDSPKGRRNDPAFKDYFNLIWKELNDHADAI